MKQHEWARELILDELLKVKGVLYNAREHPSLVPLAFPGKTLQDIEDLASDLRIQLAQEFL